MALSEISKYQSIDYHKIARMSGVSRSLLAHCCLLASAEEAKLEVSAHYMKALTVLEALRSRPWMGGSAMAGMKVAYDLVSADPTASVSILAGRVLSAAESLALVVQAPMGQYNLQQQQHFGVQQFQFGEQQYQLGWQQHQFACWAGGSHSVLALRCPGPCGHEMQAPSRP